MTRNENDDNVTLWAAALNAQLNAPTLELVKSGCDPTKGTGDWDVDIASGTIIAGQSTGEVSVGAQTVTLTDPANDTDMDSGESRIDLVSINSSGTAGVTEGTAASNPTSPDIPSGEVLVAFVHVAEADSTIADSDLFDPRVLFGPVSYPFDAQDINDGPGSGVDADSVDGIAGSSIAETAWKPDGNSPFTISSQSATISGSLADTGHDEYEFRVALEGAANTSGTWEMQWSGQTSGYQWVDNSDTRTTGESWADLYGPQEADHDVGGEILFQTHAGNGTWVHGLVDMTNPDVTAGHTETVGNKNTGDVTSFTFRHDSEDLDAATVEVFYRDL